MKSMGKKKLLGSVAVFLLIALVAGIVYYPRIASTITRIFLPRNSDVSAAAFIQSHYGKYDPRYKGYPVMDDDETSKPLYVMSECENKPIPIKGAEHLLLAMCSSPPNEEMGSHGERGMIDFYVLRKESTGWVTAAQLLKLESGSYGVAGNVKAIKLGKNFYGFLIEETWMGQGYEIGTRTIVAPKDEQLLEVAVFRSSLANSGVTASDCKETESLCEPSTSLDFQMKIDDSNASAVVFPIYVDVSGVKSDIATKARYRLDFNRRSWHYNVPAELTESF